MKKILLVDDKLIEAYGFASSIRELFGESGFYLDFITSAEAAVHIIKNCPYDAVLMDGTFLLSIEDDDERILADTQGPDAIKKIRAFSEIPIIGISGEGRMQKELLEAGANCTVPKHEWEAWITKVVEITA